MSDDRAPNESDRAGRITFCLVTPESPGNIGAAARALKNMGFTRLALVSPGDPRGEESIRMAYRARDVLDQAECFPDLTAATAGAHWVVGLTGRARKETREHRSIEALAPELWARAERQKITLLFGPEGTGLTNALLDRCHQTAFIPTGPLFSSLNLAQAVLLTAAALLRAAAPGTDREKRPLRPVLTVEEIGPLFEEMEAALRAIGFLRPGDKKVARTFRALFTRAEVDAAEATLLRALFRQMIRATRQKKSPPL